VVDKSLATEVTSFISELALLLKSGVSGTEALEIIKQEPSDFRLLSLINEIYEDVKQGISLADSLAKQPRYFEPFLVDLVREGEQQNHLAATLVAIAEYQEKLSTSASNLATRLLFALTYPVTLLLIVMVFLFFMFIWVVPTFADLFASFGGELPVLTAGIIYLSEGVVAYWWLMVAVLLLLSGWVVSAYRKNTLLFKFPVLGRLFHQIAIIRFLHTYALALAHNQSPTSALAACEQTADNQIYATLFQQIRAEITTGTLLTEAFLKQKLFPRRVKHIVVVSTKTKSADQLFSKLADIYTRQLQQQLEPTLKIFSIVMTFMVGLIIALLVIAIYLPLFKMGTVI
jgi:type IV pilus assembly protein PilC